MRSQKLITYLKNGLIYATLTGFALVMLFYFKGWGMFKDYAFSERAYQILSLVAKTLLAWLVFGGIFQPS